MLGKRFSIREAIAFGWAKSLEHIFLIVKIALTFIAVQAVVLVGLLPIGLLLHVSKESYLSIFPIILFVAYGITAALFMIGMIRLGLLRVLLDIYERNRSEVSRLFSSFNLTFTYIGASILLSLMIFPVVAAIGIGVALSGFVLQAVQAGQVVGLVLAGLAIALFFITMIILQVRFGFYAYPIVDKGFGAIGALKRSWHITKGSVLRILIFEIVLGIIPATLGLLVSLNVLAIIGAISKCWYVAAIFPALLLVIALFFLALMIPMIMLANVYVYKKLSERADQRNRGNAGSPYNQ